MPWPIRLLSEKRGFAIPMVLLLVLWLLAAYTWPGLLPARPWHPRALVYRLRGLPVHPLLPVPSGRTVDLVQREVVWPRLGHALVDYSRLAEVRAEQFRSRFAQVAIEDGRLSPDTLPLPWDDAAWPDVYAGPLQPSLLGARQAVDLTAFYPTWHAQLRANLPGVYAAVRGEDGGIAAWPRWLEVGGLLVSGTHLQRVGWDPLHLQEQGWTWDEFAQILSDVVGEDGRCRGLLIDPEDPALLLQLLGTLPDDGEARLMVEEVFRFLANMRADGLLQAAASASESIVALLEGSATAAVVANAGQLRYAQEYAVAGADPQGEQLLLLPPPRPQGRATIVPFRQWVVQPFAVSAADRVRTRVAVELAHLTSFWLSGWIAKHLAFVPVAHLVAAGQEKPSVGPFGLWNLAYSHRAHLVARETVWSVADEAHTWLAQTISIAGADLAYPALKQAWSRLWTDGSAPADVVAELFAADGDSGPAR